MTILDALSRPLRIVVVEDHELSRNGIIVSLQKKSSFEVVGEADQGDEAVAVVATHQPDVVLMDIELPVQDGIQATQAIKAQFPHIKVIMLTSHDDSQDVFAALAAGADAYCLRDIPAERLIQVIEMVYEDAVWLDPAIARQVVQALPSQAQARVAGGLGKSPLTEREMEVLQAIVDGMSNQAIADHLHISLHTVKVHVRNIIDKMAVVDRTQAAVKAIKQGYIQL